MAAKDLEHRGNESANNSQQHSGMLTFQLPVGLPVCSEGGAGAAAPSSGGSRQVAVVQLYVREQSRSRLRVPLKWRQRKILEILYGDGMLLAKGTMR